MKVTKMRTKKNQVLDESVMMTVMSDLRKRLAKAGFITEVEDVTATSIKIGQHMRSFSLDLTKHDRNVQRNPYAEKLTNLPTWDQRVIFNDIINSVLNKHKISANIKSGPYIIRKGFECMTESDWYDQKPDWIRHNESRGYCIESVNEAEYLEERRVKRLEAAKLKRLEIRKQKDAEFKHNLDSITTADILEFRNRKAKQDQEVI